MDGSDCRRVGAMQSRCKCKVYGLKLLKILGRGETAERFKSSIRDLSFDAYLYVEDKNIELSTQAQYPSSGSRARH